jgi:peptidoglycan/xylan/chitin deacetylase (PgdA/CDA1 family)
MIRTDRASAPAPTPVAVTPTFALTFDTELIWGSFDHTSPSEFERRYPDVRSTIRRILEVLDRHEVAATWAVVGHLFLSSCQRDAAGRAHPELVSPRQSWYPRDWYGADPCTDRSRDPLWYGLDVVDAIRSARTPQEIGCHSFGHALFGDPSFTREAAEADVAACVELAAQQGLRLRSFVFPRNSEGYHDVLRAHGFEAFRGVDPIRSMGWPRPLRRTAHLATHVLGSPPPVSRPVETLPGLWDLPGSMLFLHRTGIRRLATRAARMRRFRAGLARAQADGGVFHLWTHPFNLASDPDYLVGILDDMVGAAARLRADGRLAIRTMGSIVDAVKAAGG